MLSSATGRRSRATVAFVVTKSRGCARVGQHHLVRGGQAPRFISFKRIARTAAAREATWRTRIDCALDGGAGAVRYVGWAASPASVVRPKVQRSTGLRPPSGIRGSARRGRRISSATSSQAKRIPADRVETGKIAHILRRRNLVKATAAESSQGGDGPQHPPCKRRLDRALVPRT